MARGSFSRTVARAAASGGSKSYRARRPFAWYALIALICVVGTGLTLYSRNERLHPVRPSSSTLGPTASDNWHLAFAIDICGTLKANLPANPNLASTAIRTYGDGLISVAPGAVSNPAAYEGAKATLGLFAQKYPFTLTATSVRYPASGEKTWSNGDACPKSATTPAGPGTLQAELWTSPTAPGTRVLANPAAIHLTNGAMLTLAFVPAGAPIPEPSSKATLLQTLGGATVSPPSSTTPSSTRATSTTAGAGSTTSSTTKAK